MTAPECNLLLLSRIYYGPWLLGIYPFNTSYIRCQPGVTQVQFRCHSGVIRIQASTIWCQSDPAEGIFGTCCQRRGLKKIEVAKFGVSLNLVFYPQFRFFDIRSTKIHLEGFEPVNSL